MWQQLHNEYEVTEFLNICILNLLRMLTVESRLTGSKLTSSKAYVFLHYRMVKVKLYETKVGLGVEASKYQMNGDP